MTFVAQVDQVQWFVGPQVEAQKSKVKQVDEAYCIRLLDLALSQGGPLDRHARLAQRLCDEARRIVAGQQIEHPITFSGESVWTGYRADDPLDGASNNIRMLAELRLLRENTVINPLGFGDILRAFADRFGEAPDSPHTTPIKALLRSLQNRQAFNKTTNRIRIKRRDILNPIPPVGITQWYLPNDDVLGTIDRALGYYETGDISGSATDALGVLAMLDSIDEHGAIGAVDTIRDRIVALMNDGRAFAAFAGMVAQLHHSMPETMMALNLMPRRLRAHGPLIAQIYSPFLTNANLEQIAGVYGQWQQARWNALGGANVRPDGEMRALFVLQDIFQMPNIPREENEIAIVVPFRFEHGGQQPDSTNPVIFGEPFYNVVVAQLNTANPGPAITLQKLSKAIFQLIFPGNFNPAVVAPRFPPSVQARVEAAMQLPRNALVDADSYERLVAPFLGLAGYGRVEPAEIANA
ncbi:hypothetical protein OU426_17480 [Frigidibacter sp. RF13]|uniref:hypothetical protein n=1 Tax=Frigidibacter sp. RF13 TaxID=2997340 RepID=UPI00227226C2|nr:hypothetical protein [Frigidibacter sp. RF13]MCY1128653.1 hypothetical protein [Frigidibacter sp. RF13]